MKSLRAWDVLPPRLDAGARELPVVRVGSPSVTELEPVVWQLLVLAREGIMVAKLWQLPLLKAGSENSS